MSMEVKSDRKARITDLTRQIEAGTYRVNADRIVDGMMSKTWQELNPTEREVVIRSIHHQNRRARLNLYRAKAEELQREAAAQSVGHCPVHNVLYTIRTGDRYKDCLWCQRWKRENFSEEQGMVSATLPPDEADDAYGGGWSAYHGKVTWFDWLCVTVCFLVLTVFLVIVCK